MLGRDRGDARALPHPLRLLGAAERARARFPEFLPRLDTYEKDGAVWARSSAYGDEQDRVLIRSRAGGTPTYRAADVVYLADKLDRGFDRAIYVLGADHHGTATGTRPSRACSDTTPSGSRCCSTSSCT